MVHLDPQLIKVLFWKCLEPLRGNLLEDMGHCGRAVRVTVWFHFLFAFCFLAVCELTFLQLCLFWHVALCAYPQLRAE